MNDKTQREIIKNIGHMPGARRNDAELLLNQESTLNMSSHDDLKLFDNMALLGPSTGIYDKKISSTNENRANKAKRTGIADNLMKGVSNYKN